MKKSFTLIEIIISVMILSVLFFAMSGVLKNLKITKEILEKNFAKSSQKELMIKTLYYDLLNAESLKIIHSQNSDYDRIYLRTSNSLYHLIYPNVLWYVSKNKNSLIRVESPYKIRLPNDNLFFMDKFEHKVKIFKIYKNKNKILLFIKTKKPFYFEIITAL